MAASRRIMIRGPRQGGTPMSFTALDVAIFVGFYGVVLGFSL